MKIGAKVNTVNEELGEGEVIQVLRVNEAGKSKILCQVKFPKLGGAIRPFYKDELIEKKPFVDSE